MKTRLGIVGCGQLSQMLGEAARRQGFSVTFLCLDEVPVVLGLGPIFQQDDIDSFLSHCDVVTVERENLPDALLERCDSRVGLAPNIAALMTLRERDTQKAMLDQLDIPTSPWGRAESAADLAALLAASDGQAFRCKRILGGYDGGGQWRVACAQDIETIPEQGYPLIAEAEISIERELAIVVGRDQTGATTNYPVTENFMRDGILIGSIIPAEADDATLEAARDYATRLISAMNYVGVLAVEFFVTAGKLIVNEIAPRVHNTGHWSIGAVGADQFTQHVRLALGYAVTYPVFSESAAMINLLDDKLPARMPEGPIRTLMQTYGKGIRKGRKLGHLTLLGPDANEVRQAAEALIAELH